MKLFKILFLITLFITGSCSDSEQITAIDDLSSEYNSDETYYNLTDF